jgi:hypothetical protein
VPPRRGTKEGADVLGVDPLPAHACSKAGVTHAPVAALADASEDALPAFRKLFTQPAVEQMIDRFWQAQQYS